MWSYGDNCAKKTPGTQDYRSSIIDSALRQPHKIMMSCRKENTLPVKGAGDGIRTRDSLLGKQLRYHCATPAYSRSIAYRNSHLNLSRLDLVSVGGN